MNGRSMALTGLLCLATGCIPPIHITTAFSSRFADNNVTSITAVSQREGPRSGTAVGSPTNGLGRPVVAAVIQGDNRAVALYDVTTHTALWSQALTARSTPEILGDALVVDAVGGTRILDLATGRQRASLEHNGLDFAGAARDGDTIVLCFASGLQGTGGRSGKVVAVGAASGSERWSHEIAGLVGRPAARNGLAFIPWDRQSIAVLDMQSGIEQARVRSTDDLLSWVQATPDGIFYGGRGLYRLTPASASGTRAGSDYLENPIRGVPGDPMLFRDGFLPTTGTRTARDKIRFAFRPVVGADGHVGVQNDTVYLGYYRDLLALDVHGGAVRWAQRLEDDVESLTVTPTGVFVVAGNGKIRGVNAETGAVSLVADLGANMGAIATDLGGLALGTGGTAPEGTVRAQLVSLVRDTDNRLVPFRGYLVGLVAALPEPEVTRDLLDLYTQRSIPGQLRQSIATALQSRRNGAQFLVAALQDHYDYLEGRQAPPLQVIAPTLVSMGAHDAVPGLLSHLLDHETPVAALPDVVTAVATLGEASVVPALQQWVQLYKADSSFAGDSGAALASATDAIFRYGDASSRDWLQRLGHDALATAGLKTHVAGLFTREAAEARTRASAATESERLAALQEELNHLHEAQDAVHEQLTEAQIDEVWAAHTDEIRACAQGAVTRNPTLNQIRVVITVHSELPSALMARTPPAQSGGTDAQHPRHTTTTAEATEWVHAQMAGLQAQRARVRLGTYAPNDAQLRTCMEHVIQPLEFPAFRGVRQEFRRVIDTRAARPAGGGTDAFTGLGTDAQGRELPWWLVSAPSLVVEAPRVPAAAGTPTPGTRPGAAVTGRPGAATATPGGAQTPGASTAPGTASPGTAAPGTAPAHPWWEE